MALLMIGDTRLGTAMLGGESVYCALTDLDDDKNTNDKKFGMNRLLFY